MQAVIGCVYGFVPLGHLTKEARQVPRPSSPAQSALLRGVVFECIRRKALNLSPADAKRVVVLVEEIGKGSDADFRMVVTGLRKLLRIGLSKLPHQIREIIDAQYPTKLTIESIAGSLAEDPQYANIVRVRRRPR